jgi:hypothetical protein
MTIIAQRPTYKAINKPQLQGILRVSNSWLALQCLFQTTSPQF